ncbi:hypothetical protein D9V37_01505 [Nocardioides mangrovicus]|uniref:Uncharacterized protein n=1 Tax=Nocardioides mangrovicus TaxID=2478913 RepID=A0A3L8P7E9_9ACTN|nr:hypothetical protein [Nocardioides mangrovicus]RLV50673.1 hypothetical protein D9V37_01505 [Nocardioides mangrovicus]
MAYDPTRTGPRSYLPWFLAGTALALVALVYALLSRYGWFVVGAAVLLLTLVGAVAGMVLRDSHDRVVTAGHSLREAVRRLAHALWY